MATPLDTYLSAYREAMVSKDRARTFNSAVGVAGSLAQAAESFARINQMQYNANVNSAQAEAKARMAEINNQLLEENLAPEEAAAEYDKRFSDWWSRYQEGSNERGRPNISNRRAREDLEDQMAYLREAGQTEFLEAYQQDWKASQVVQNDGAYNAAIQEGNAAEAYSIVDRAYLAGGYTRTEAAERREDIGRRTADANIEASLTEIRDEYGEELALRIIDNELTAEDRARLEADGVEVPDFRYEIQESLAIEPDQRLQQQLINEGLSLARKEGIESLPAMERFAQEYAAGKLAEGRERGYTEPERAELRQKVLTHWNEQNAFERKADEKSYTASYGDLVQMWAHDELTLSILDGYTTDNGESLAERHPALYERYLGWIQQREAAKAAAARGGGEEFDEKTHYLWQRYHEIMADKNLTHRAAEAVWNEEVDRWYSEHVKYDEDGNAYLDSPGLSPETILELTNKIPSERDFIQNPQITEFMDFLDDALPVSEEFEDDEGNMVTRSNTGIRNSILAVMHDKLANGVPLKQVLEEGNRAIAQAQTRAAGETIGWLDGWRDKFRTSGFEDFALLNETGIEYNQFRAADLVGQSINYGEGLWEERLGVQEALVPEGYSSYQDFLNRTSEGQGIREAHARAVQTVLYNRRARKLYSEATGSTSFQYVYNRETGTMGILDYRQMPQNLKVAYRGMRDQENRSPAELQQWLAQQEGVRFFRYDAIPNIDDGEVVGHVMGWRVANDLGPMYDPARAGEELIFQPTELENEDVRNPDRPPRDPRVPTDDIDVDTYEPPTENHGVIHGALQRNPSTSRTKILQRILDQPEIVFSRLSTSDQAVLGSLLTGEELSILRGYSGRN